MTSVDEGQPSDEQLQSVLREELSRLLASPSFMRSPVLCRLLTFLVEHRLRGDSPPPKAYAIATQALGRAADFDPSLDSYPRVMVGRLRNAIEKYYTETPWLYRLRIPQGSYEVVVQYRAAPPHRTENSSKAVAEPDSIVAVQSADIVDRAPVGRTAPTKPVVTQSFSWPALQQQTADSMPAWPETADVAAPPPSLRGWKKWLVMAAAIVVAALLGGGAALLANHYASLDEGWPFADGEMLVPRPSVRLSVEGEARASDGQRAADVVEFKLRDGLRRFEMLGVAGLSDSGAAYHLRAQVLPLPEGQLEIGLALRYSQRDALVWEKRVIVAREDQQKFRSLNPIIAQVAGDYGVIVADQMERAPKDFRVGYPCIAQYQRDRFGVAVAPIDKLQQCAEKSAKMAPEDPLILSTLSGVNMIAAANIPHAAQAMKMRQEAEAYAARAYDVAPSSAHAILAQARLHFFNGDCGHMGRVSAAALAVNEYDGDMTSQLGFYHLMCGNLAQGEKFAMQAMLQGGRAAGLAVHLAAAMKNKQLHEKLTGNPLANGKAIARDRSFHMAMAAYVVAAIGAMKDAPEHQAEMLKLAATVENARAEDVLRRLTSSPIDVDRVLADLHFVGVVPSHAALK